MFKNFQIVTTFLGAAIFALPVFAQSSAEEDRQAFLDIIIENGCSMDETEAEFIFPQSGYDRDWTRKVAGELIDAGEVEISNGQLILLNGACDGQSGFTPLQQQFIEIIATAGCQVSEEGVHTLFPPNGMDVDVAYDIGEFLMDSGFATLIEETEVLVVNPEYCTPIGDAVSGENAVLNDPQVQEFLTIMAANNCQISEEAVRSVFPAAGMDADLAFDIGENLMDAGLASFSETQDLVVTAPTCVGGAPMEAGGSLLDNPRVQEFLTILAANGCRIGEDDVRSVFPAAGMDADEAFDIAEDLVDAGIGEFTPEEQMVVGAEYCTASQATELDLPDIEALEAQAVEDAMEAAEDAMEAAMAAAESAIDVTPAVSDVVSAPIANDGAAMGIFMSVMAQNGCSLEEGRARAEFATAGLDMENVYEIAEQLILTGEAEYIDDDTVLVVTSAACEAANPSQLVVTPAVEIPDVTETPVVETPIDTADPEALFLQMMAINGCELTQANAREMTAAAGVDFNVAMGIAAQMLNDGRATSPDGGQTLQVGPPLCVAGGTNTSAPRDIFIEVLRGNNCSATASEFGTLFPVDGLDQSTAFGLINELEADGVITLPPTRDVITLTAENCR